MTGIFDAVVEQGGKVRLDHPGQWRAFVTKLAGDTGEEICIEVYPKRERKSRAQEKGFHVMVRSWAHEKGHQIDDLKQSLLLEIFGTREATNPLTGEVTLVLREPHTSTLSMADYSKLIDETMEIAARVDGYILTAPDEYTRQQELKRKAAERKAAKESRLKKSA